MNMGRILSGAMVLGLAAAAAYGADFSIVIPEQAAVPDRTAAAELREHLSKATGKEVEIVSAAPAAGGRVIYLGSDGNKVDFSKYGAEEYLVKALGPGELVIGGGKPRGTLYGVFEFCERELGVAWLDPDCTYIPARPGYAWAPGLELKGRPGFDYRNAEPYVGTNPGGVVSRYMLRNRNNSFIYIKYDDKLAAYGVFQECGSPGPSHTFNKYTAGWGEAEAEALALYQGKRIKSGGGEKPGQVCLSSPLARRLFTEQLRQYIESDRQGKPREQWPVIYEISQNDTRWGWCECADCAALAKKYGTWSGVLLDFINSIARAVAGDYPEIRIRTLAYSLTLEPPRGITADPNVYIRYAQTAAEIASVVWNGSDRDSMRSFQHPNNRTSRERMEKWAATGCKFAVWDYWCLYGGKGKWPTVNIRTIVDNIRFYHRLNARMLLAEAANVDLTSFHPLRIWIGNQAMNHPDLDYEKTLDRFFTGYYGPAAEPMRKLLELIQQANDKVPGAIGVLSVKDRPDLTPDFFRQAETLLAAAEKAAGDNPALLFRIHRERAPFYRARLDLLDKMPLPADELNTVLDRYAEYHKMLCTPQFMGNTRGPRMISNVDSYVQGIRLLDRVKPVPELAGREVIAEFLWKDLITLGEGGYYVTAHDPEAAGQTCIAIDKRLVFYGEGSLRAGVYDPVAKKSLGNLIIPKDRLPRDEKFHLYHLGRIELSPSCFFWAHPSWGITVDLSPYHDKSKKDNTVDIYFSTKLQGPDYVPGSTRETLYKFDRLILLKPVLNSVSVNGGFEPGNSPDTPKGWFKNGWHGYQPFARHRLADGVFHISEANAEYGFEWQSPMIAAKPGERLLITAEVKGKGSCGFRFQCYDASSKWLGIAQKIAWNRLDEDWKHITAELTVVSLPDKAATAKVTLSIMGLKGHELFIRNLSVSR